MISIENLEKKAYFNIDNNEYYEGYHIEDRRWNGWATPKFEKHVADFIAHNFSSTDFNIKYNEKNDYYSIIQKENGKIILEEKIKGQIINTTEGQKKVYGLGAFDWTWEDYTIEELEKNKDAIIITNGIIEKDDSINIEY